MLLPFVTFQVRKKGADFKNKKRANVVHIHSPLGFYGIRRRQKAVIGDFLENNYKYCDYWEYLVPNIVIIMLLQYMGIFVLFVSVNIVIIC